MPRRTRTTTKKTPPTRARRADKAVDRPEPDDGGAAQSEGDELEGELEGGLDDDDVSVVDGDDEDLDEEGDEDDQAGRPAPPRAAPVPPPVSRPSPGRPPSAKDEPEPPFLVGERVELIRNTRPRTGTPIGNHRVGAMGRIETVLSQTAIVRFDDAPDTKEVVAFVCLESRDPEAQQRRRERELELAAERAEAEGGGAPRPEGGR